MRRLYILFAISFLLTSSAVFAQNDRTPPSRETCEGVAMAERFPMVILGTGKEFSLIEMGMIFVDLFERNTCLRRDIFNVLQKIESIAAGMRSAMYNCNVAQFDGYVSEYFKADMELYFLRNWFQEGKKPLVEAHDLESKMVKKYKELYNMPKKDVIEAIEEFKRYYDPNDYIKCEDIDWVSFKKKWDNFIKNMKAIFSGDLFAQTIEKEVADYKEAYPPSEDKEDPNKSEGFWGNVGGFFKKHLDIKLKVEDIEVRDVFDKEEWKKALEKAGVKAKESAQSFDQFFESKKIIEEDVKQRTEALKAEAENEVLYLQGSGILADKYLCRAHNLNESLKIIINKTKQLNACAKIPLDKQCSNKKPQKKEMPE